MPKPKKIVIVTATNHPYHDMWMKLAKEAAEKLGTELEVKYEDYVYLVDHGDTDEYGMAWLPQILIELDNGEVKVLLSQLPLNEAFQPDYEKALETILKKAGELAEE